MRFMLGDIVGTPGAVELLERAGVPAVQFIARHVNGDWGDLEREDKIANDQALKNGGRIFSAYNVSNERLWIITEAVDDRGIRASTCLMLPSEY